MVDWCGSPPGRCSGQAWVATARCAGLAMTMGAVVASCWMVRPGRSRLLRRSAARNDMLECVFDEAAAGHDGGEAAAVVLEDGEVAIGIAIDDQQIGMGAGDEFAELAVGADDFGVDESRGADDILRLHG